MQAAAVTGPGQSLELKLSPGPPRKAGTQLLEPSPAVFWGLGSGAELGLEVRHSDMDASKVATRPNASPKELIPRLLAVGASKAMPFLKRHSLR